MGLHENSRMMLRTKKIELFLFIAVVKLKGKKNKEPEVSVFFTTSLKEFFAYAFYEEFNDHFRRILNKV